MNDDTNDRTFNRMLRDAFAHGYNLSKVCERPRSPQSSVDAWLEREYRIWMREVIDAEKSNADP